MTPSSSTSDTRQPDARLTVDHPRSVAPSSHGKLIDHVGRPAGHKTPWDGEHDDLGESHSAHAEPVADAEGIDGALMAAADGLGQLDTSAVQSAGAATEQASGATSAAHAGTGLNPVMIGAGLLGAVAIGAAASGGGGGNGSHHARPDSTAQANNARPSGQDQSLLAAQPSEHPQDTTPTVELRPIGPAQATGPASSPEVALEGLTRLNVASFEQAAVGDTPLRYVRITHIFAADGDDAEGRVVRFGNEGARNEPLSMSRAALVLKEPNSSAPADDTLTAYEVIRIEGGITRADAEKMAAAKGGRLLQINDATEMAWIDQNLFGILGEHDGDGSEASAEQQVKNGAWFGGKLYDGADASHDAIIRASGRHADGARTYETASDKLGGFVIEYGNYVSPLGLLGTDGKVRAILPGTTLSLEEVKHLVWNGDQNRVGRLKFEAVQGPENDAEVVPGAKEVVVDITESAAVTPPMGPVVPDATARDSAVTQTQTGSTSPDTQTLSGPSQVDGNASPQPPAARPPQGTGEDTPSQPGNAADPGSQPQSGHAPSPVPAEPEQTVSVRLDSFLPLDAAIFRGTDSSKSPAFIRITNVTETQAPGTSHGKSPLVLNKGGIGTNADQELGDANGQESIVAAADFDKISWNATQNQGGSFRFQALDAQKQPLSGSAHTITIFEQPAAPHYEASRQLVGVAKDGSHTFDTAVLAGTGTSATRIRILDVKESDDTNQAESALRKADGTGLQSGAEISSADFGKLSWDTSTNTGGSFKFVALDQHGHALGAEQTVTIYERPEAPVYDKDVRATVGHDHRDGTLSASLLEGTDKSKAPAWIRITDVQKSSDTQSGESALSVLRNQIAQRILAGDENDVISRADFGNLRWDASHNQGGSFTFQALDQHKQPISSVQPQTITVFEQPAKPSYEAPSPELTLQHQATGLHKLDEAWFKGSVDDNKPSKVKITSFQAIGDNHQNATESPLFLGNGQTGDEANSQKTAITLNQIIDSENFGKIYWDSTHNQSGHLTFQALDQYGTPIHGSDPVTILVKENAASSAAPDEKAGEADASSTTGSPSSDSSSGSDTGTQTPQDNSRPESLQADSTDVNTQPHAPTPDSQTEGQNLSGEGSGSGMQDQKGDAAPTNPATPASPASPAGAEGTSTDKATQETAKPGTAEDAGRAGNAAAGPSGQGEETADPAPGVNNASDQTAASTDPHTLEPKGFFSDPAFSTVAQLAPMHDEISLNIGF